MQHSLSIAIDAMSGDLGPASCVAGAIEVLRSTPDLEITLVGIPSVLEPLLLTASKALRSRVHLCAASQIVGMDERPRDVMRHKKDSSLRRAIDLVASGQASACISSGNTGALMATSHFVLGMIAGIERPAIVANIPATGGHTCMLDLGANVSATPVQLFQFAVMGSVMAHDGRRATQPRVGLLNVGAEDIKGHDVVQAAHALLKRSSLNYCGYVEGNDIFTGAVDVVVTDGFTGNVALKTMEGLARMHSRVMHEELTCSPWRRLGSLFALPALRGFRQRFDPRRYNGASMVGLAGIVVKSHGSADAVAFAHAVRLGIDEARRGVPSEIGMTLKAQAV